MHKVLVVFGTRPEAVKMAPVVHALERSEALQSVVCVTAQHREMLDQTLEMFQIRPGIDLDLMLPKQRLDGLTARALTALGPVLARERPDVVLVHGDTTTAFTAALAAFYAGVPVGHVEAGLRTHDLTQPFPEEMNRVLTDRLCRFLFAPTALARRNLVAEGIPEDRIVVTGNTVVDAVHMALPLARKTDISELVGPDDSPGGRQKGGRGDGARIILVTAHRRESFGKTFEGICLALRDTADRFEDIQIIYPVHLNPNVQDPVRHLLGDHPRIRLIEPVPYLTMLHLMDRAHIIATDSGGLQEEAPSLDKPVIVLREMTERPEGVEAGVLRLVGTDREAIAHGLSELLTDDALYASMAKAPNPFGDGHAAGRIVEALEERL